MKKLILVYLSLSNLLLNALICSSHRLPPGPTGSTLLEKISSTVPRAPDFN